jgi:hypothetical protein
MREPVSEKKREQVNRLRNNLCLIREPVPRKERE